MSKFIIIEKNGTEKRFSKAAWEALGKSTDGWHFVKNEDESDTSLPKNTQPAVKYVPEEVKSMSSFKKETSVTEQIQKTLISDFSDDEFIKEYHRRFPASKENSKTSQPEKELEPEAVNMETENQPLKAKPGRPKSNK